MTELDQVTQSNASASQEMAGASEELSGQTDALADMMQFFKVGDANDSFALAAHQGHTNPAALQRPNKGLQGNDLDLRNFDRY